MRLKVRWLTTAAAVLAWAGALSSQATRPPLRYAAQGWTQEDRALFYTTTQGSQLVPYSWYLALEQPGDVRTRFNDGSLARYGYLENRDPQRNPDRLPLGFVKDGDTDWLGLTCAACHTNDIDSGGNTWRIDGAPALADTWAFLTDLGDALAQTAQAPDGARFTRFAANLRGRAPTPAQRTELYARLKTFSDAYAKFIESSRTQVPWGHGRIDAFGMIFNRATGIDLDRWENTRPPDAPVSMPFLWDTHWHDYVQWNASAPNAIALQRLGRNVGEVLGVFAHVTPDERGLLRAESSARPRQLLDIEHRLSRLRSPAWPFGGIDQQAAARGAAIYQQYCVGCHALAPRDQPVRPQSITKTPIKVVGTDPLMATNAFERTASSGVLQGRRVTLSGTPLAANVKSVELTVAMAMGVILEPKSWRSRSVRTDLGLFSALRSDDDAGAGAGPRLTGAADMYRRAQELGEQHRKGTEELVYKARPLNGIWATAPYLHNGSVPTLWQMVQPAARKAQFFVGSREFDPKEVGFRFDGGGSPFDATRPGNLNIGHDSYLPKGTEMSDDDRWALVEYMKTL
jgi:mono/diheme cytochrome c family protein